VPTYRVSICKGPDCRRNGAERVAVAAQDAVRDLDLRARCTLARGGCYGLCHLGPNVVIREERPRPPDPFRQEDFQLMGWEDEVHYGQMTAESIRTVLSEHVGHDRPVDALKGTRED
jgi:(2Fe-2S) ferredoxin